MHVMMYIRSCSTPVYTGVGIPAVFPLWGIHVNAGLPLLPSPMMATKGRDKDEKKKGRKGQKHDPPTSEDVNDSTPAKNNSILRRLSKKKSSGRGSSSQSLKALDSQPLPDCARNSPDLQSQNQSVVSVTSTSFTPASSDNVFPPDESSSDLQGELFPDDPEKVSRHHTKSISCIRTTWHDGHCLYLTSFSILKATQTKYSACFSSYKVHK